MRMDSVRSIHATRVRILRLQMFQSTRSPGVRLSILAASSLTQTCGSRSPARHQAPFNTMVSGGMASIAVTVRVRRNRRLKSRSGRFSIGWPLMAVMRAATANATSGASFTPGCCRINSAERHPLVGRYIQQKHVGHSRRCRAANLLHQRVLHQEHRQCEHYPHAERHHRGLRLIPRPVKIRHAVAHHARKARHPSCAGTSGTRAAWPNPANESSASPMARASAKKPPVRTATERPPSVSVPATTPVPNRIATRARYAGAIPRRRGPRFASTSRRKISAGRMSRIPNNGGTVNSSVTRHATGDALHRRPRVPIRRARPSKNTSRSAPGTPPPRPRRTPRRSPAAQARA